MRRNSVLTPNGSLSNLSQASHLSGTARQVDGWCLNLIRFFKSSLSDLMGLPAGYRHRLGPWFFNIGGETAENFGGC